MLSSLIKSADWKSEKHVPVITITPVPSVPGSQLPVSGNIYEVEVAVGKEIPHPNTVEHHIAWIALYYTPEPSSPLPVTSFQTPVELARAEFSAHGPDIFTEPVLKTIIKLPTPPPTHSFTLHAVAYCNLHGLWEGEIKITV